MAQLNQYVTHTASRVNGTENDLNGDTVTGMGHDLVTPPYH